MVQPISLNALRLPVKLPAGATDPFRRWWESLLRCLPRGMRRWIALRSPLLVVVPKGDDADLLRQLGEEREPIGALDLRTGGPLGALTVDAPKRGWAETWIELPDSLILLRHVTLPVQVRDNLRRVVSFEIDRLTPFQPADVYFDTSVAGPLARGTRIDVLLAVCRRDRVDDWLERLREAGSPASRLTWQGAWHGANLLPPGERPRRRRFGSWLSRSLLLVLLVLLAAALITPIWQKTQQQERLTRELTREQIAAEEVEKVREDLELARLGSIEVLQRKRGQPRMTDLLRELTDLLPDGTWVQTMNFRDGEVDIRGESDAATALIGLLEQGPGIEGVSFRSPVMQVASTGKERFHITFDYTRPGASP